MRLQRRVGKKWERVATEDSFQDTVQREPGDAYLETYQFDACDKPGRYRFKVTGRAFDGSRARPYTVVSDAFNVTPARLEADAPAGGRFRVRYPSPGAGALIYTPRLLTSGYAEVTENGSTRFVKPDASGVFDIGAATLVGVTDGCGNATM